MDDLEKIKHFVKSTDKKILKGLVYSDPCYDCAKKEKCKYKKKGMLCSEAAKDVLEKEIDKLEKSRSREK